MYAIDSEIGGKHLWQWDTGRRLLLHDIPAGTYIEFAPCGAGQALVMEAYAGEAGAVLVDVPNQCLTQAADIALYACYTDDRGRYTERYDVLEVLRRPKPDDYVHTETEVFDYRKLAAEVGETVRYVEQTLTPEQQERARANIGAAAAAAAGMIDDNAIAKTRVWSSKQTVDRLCREDVQAGAVVQGHWIEGYPLGVKAYIEAKQADGVLDADGNVQPPSPDNVREISGVDSVSVTIGGEDAQSNPDNRTTYTITLPETSYGGYIDWERGKYVQTYKKAALYGNETMREPIALSDGSGYTTYFSQLTMDRDIPGYDVICSHRPTKTSQDMTNMPHPYIAPANNNHPCWMSFPPECTTRELISSHLAAQAAAGTPITVVYKLAVPIEHDLADLPELIALGGVTTVYTDAGDVEVRGAADESIVSTGDTAAVGDVLRVKAVDADGKPTEWECAAVGGGEQSVDYRLIREIIVPEDVTADTESDITWWLSNAEGHTTHPCGVEIDNDDNGEALALREIYLNIHTVKGSTSTYENAFINGTQVSYCHAVTAGNYTTYYFKKVGSEVYVQRGTGTNITVGMNEGYLGRIPQGVVIDDFFKKIKWTYAYGSGYLLPGTTIAIWGR